MRGDEMTTGIMEPELEEKVSIPDVLRPNDDDDDDKPGWLVTYVDGKQPELVRLDGTDDEELSEDEVFERFDKADKGGASFFKLGRFRGRMAAIRSLSWSEDVDLPELIIFDSLQDRVENVLESMDEAAQSVAQAAQHTVLLQQAQVGLQNAQAQLFESLDAEGELEEGEGEGQGPVSPPAVKALKPLKIGRPKTSS